MIILNPEQFSETDFFDQEEFMYAFAQGKGNFVSSKEGAPTGSRANSPRLPE